MILKIHKQFLILSSPLFGLLIFMFAHNAVYLKKNKAKLLHEKNQQDTGSQ
jgi:hypothetical protein